MKKLCLGLPAVTTELWQFPAHGDREVTVVPGLLSAWRQDEVLGNQSELGPSGYIGSV